MMLQQSPAGRWIERVEGNPDDIIDRGDAITTLGQQMLDCADTLENIKNQALSDGSQQGKAIEKLKESVGDSHDILRQAGELYEPVGPVIRTYGFNLTFIQPVLNGHADDCEEKWNYYRSLPGDENGNTTPEAGGGVLGFGGHDADSPEAEAEAEENREKKAAYDDYLESANAFDSSYDTWEQAFNDAVDGVEDEMAGSIEDGWWDDWSSAIDIAGKILGAVAFVLGVIAIFAGGWILLAVLAVVSLAVLAITYAQYKHGEKDGWDLALAALAVVPIGKVANLTKLVHGANLLRGTGGAVNALSKLSKSLDLGPVGKTIMARSGPAVERLGNSAIRSNLIGTSIPAAFNNTARMYASNMDLARRSLPLIRATSVVDSGVSRAGAALGHWGRLNTVDGLFGVNLPQPWKQIGAFV